MKLNAIWQNDEGTLVFAIPDSDEVLVWHPERDYPSIRLAHEDAIHKWGNWTPVDTPIGVDVPVPKQEEQ